MSISRKSQRKPVVLIVDDDDDVRDLATTTLRHAGCDVLAVRNAEEALAIVRGDALLHLLFTDIIMPGMTGWELAHEAKKVRPDLRVIYTSGFSRDVPFGEHGIGYGPLLPKPWLPRQLHEHVLKILASA